MKRLLYLPLFLVVAPALRVVRCSILPLLMIILDADAHEVIQIEFEILYLILS